MPARKAKGGYRWGSHGKVFKTKAAAERAGKREPYKSGGRASTRRRGK